MGEFSRFAAGVLNNSRARCALLRGSLYAPQLALYFKFFESSQFYIIPYKLALTAMASIVHQLMIRLKIKFSVTKPKSTNRFKHPELNATTSPVMRARLQQAVSRLGGSSLAIAKLLSES